MAENGRKVPHCRRCKEPTPGGVYCEECGAKVCPPSLSSIAADPATEWLALLEKDVDLVEAASRLLRMVEWVDGQKGLFEQQSPGMNVAAWRYAEFWMPLAASYTGSEPILPPLDVEWAWLVHRLAPQFYYDDCLRVCDKMLEYPVIGSDEEIERARERGKKVWQAQFQESWDCPQTEEEMQKAADAIEGRVSRLKYHLGRSAEAQAQFTYQTSRPQFRDAAFRERALRRYLRFISLAPRRVAEMIVPSYDVDMLWHSHMWYPQLYKKHDGLGRLRCKTR